MPAISTPLTRKKSSPRSQLLHRQSANQLGTPIAREAGERSKERVEEVLEQVWT